MLNKQIRVIYSNGARFAGGGIGNTSYHAVRGLHRHGVLDKLLCGSYRETEIPSDKIKSIGMLSRVWRKTAVYDKNNQIDYQYRTFYNKWAARQLTNCDIFHGWSGYNLRAFQRAKQQGSIAVLDRALAHPAYLDKLMQEEAHTWQTPYQPAITTNFVQQEIATADVVFIPSEFVYQTFQAEGVPTEKLIQIPFGVDTNCFHPATSGKSTSKPFRVLFVGHVSVRKGVPYLLDAWQQLNWKQAELWLIGANKLPSDIQHRYRHLSNIHYKGYVSNPVTLFQQADVFVFPSIAEGSALVTYEALACGLPIITTLNAGSVLQDTKQGYIVPVRDAAAIVKRLEQLRSDRILRQKFGEAARHRADEFSWEQYGDRVAQTLLKVYQQYEAAMA